MIFYFIIVLLLSLILIYQYFAFIRIYYIDSALSQFRELRHECVLFLSSKVKDELPLEEVREHREFLRSLNAVIIHFDKIKISLTRFKSVKAIYSNIIFSSRKLAEVQLEKSQSLNAYKDRFGLGILTLFNAIPFCRVRLFLHLLNIIASFFVRLGIVSFKKYLQRVEQLCKIEGDIQNRNRSCFN